MTASPQASSCVRTIPEIILTTFQGEFHSPDGSPAKRLFTKQVPAEDRLLLYYWDFLDNTSWTMSM